MKKSSGTGARRLFLVAALCCIGVFAGSSVASAATQTLTTDVNVNGSSTHYAHTYTIEVNCATGAFTGTGTDESISGTIAGGSISATSTYGNGYSYSFTALVDGSGNFSGTQNGTDTDHQNLDVSGTGATVPSCPAPVAKNKDQCKNGGWKTVTRTDGSSFKNQGDCVSYTQNGK